MPSPKFPSARDTFGRAFRTVRVAKGKTQEDFVQASGRTHVSMLERGVNAPTLTTIEGLAAELKVHPLTLVTLTYSTQPGDDAVASLLDFVKAEIAALDTAKFVIPGSRSRTTAPKITTEDAATARSPRTQGKT